MTNSNLSAIQAHVITTQLDDHGKAKDDSSPKSDYCYIFTGGYLSDAGNQTIGQPTSEPTERPAGEIGFSKEDSSFSITVVDSTAKNLKTRGWNLGTTGTLRGENFSPAP